MSGICTAMTTTIRVIDAESHVVDEVDGDRHGEADHADEEQDAWVRSEGGGRGEEKERRRRGEGEEKERERKVGRGEIERGKREKR
eukprot:233739-Rhodomonas_salina.1